VNQAYKDLAFIWHPDRIPKDNLRLQQKAQEKVRLIRPVINCALTTEWSKCSASAIPKTSRYHEKPSQSYQQSPFNHQQARKHYSDLSGADLRKEKDLCQEET